MRDYSRIDVICDNFATLWKHYPDMRFGQLIENFIHIDGRMDFFYQEDDDTIARIYDILDDIYENEYKE